MVRDIERSSMGARNVFIQATGARVYLVMGIAELYLSNGAFDNLDVLLDHWEWRLWI